MKRTLFFGDNLEILRQHVADESVDLVYLDPPFNSNRSYNVLFKEKDSRPSTAQIEAFGDTWHWTPDTQAHYDQLVTGVDVPGDVAKAIDAFRMLLGENDVMAYLVMMTPRLLELHRVLKQTGSLYLHCDPTASHYLKVICDQIFDPRRFRSEIIWKRSSAHSDTKQGRMQHGHIHDTILFYTKSDRWTWNPIYTPYEASYINEFYKYEEEGTGRRYRLGDLTAAKPGGDTSYEFKGARPYKGRFWAYSREKMEEFDRQGRLVYSKTGMPQYKRYLDEMPGTALQDIWTDIRPIGSSTEALGYPTQKPVSLLERIIRSSSNEGDIVLDPFCGCGTTISAAEKLNRSWIGIDITYLAIALIEQRLHDAHPGVVYEVQGVPKDLSGADNLFQKSHKNFEMWAVRQIGGRPNPKGGGDEGADGIIRFFIDGKRFGTVVVSVKGGTSVNPAMVRELLGTVNKEAADIGILITRAKPTEGMQSTAAKAGFYTWPINFEKFQRIQIISVEEILAGSKPHLPPLHGSTFAQAPRAVRDSGQLSF